MKFLAALVVALLLLAFVAQRQEQTASVVVCGEVKGGQVLTAKGVDWAEDFGNWLHDMAETPVDSNAVQAAVKGVEKVLFYWLRAAFLSAKGIALDPEILQLQQDAADARAVAESQCTPCPTALPQDSSPLASLGAAPVTGSPEEITRQVAARYWPADQVDTAVAIAGAESTYNPKAHNNYGAGVEGLWQINVQAHRDLVAGKNLQDPSVNAYAAHQIWLDAGKSWKPWTTYTSGSYRKFLKPSAAAQLTAAVSSGATPNDRQVAPEVGATPVNPQNVGCQSAGMPELRVATWNTYCGASRATGCDSGRLAARVARVLGGMQTIAKQADIINTQEMSSGELRDRVLHGLDGFSIAGGKTSHPMFIRDSACTITSDKSDPVFTRGTPMEGPDQGNRWVNTAVLNCGGKTVTDINFHQLPKIQVGGGLNKAWPKRSRLATEIYATAQTSARTHMAQGAVVETCDCNYDGDLGGLAAAAGLTRAASVFGDLKQATRTRDIDQIMWSAGAPTGEKVLGSYGSDHSARVVTFPGSVDPAETGLTMPVPPDFTFPGQNSPQQALAWFATHQGENWGGRCLAAVGRSYGLSGTTPVNGHFYATGQWYAMPARYKHSDGSEPPAGALVFWDSSNVAGHVAESAGNGEVWSTWTPQGHGIGKVPIAQVDAIGPRLGWSAPYFIGKTQAGAA